MRSVVTMLLLCGATAFGQELPDAPSFSKPNQPRTFDMVFWITAGVYGASVAGDALTKAIWDGRTSVCPSEGIATGLSGKRPTDARASLIMAGEFAITSIVSYEFKKHNLHLGRVRLWELPFAVRTYGHGHSIIENLAGCR